MYFEQNNKKIIELWKETAKKLKGVTQRIFKAKVVEAIGVGGQRKAEKEMNWNRATIRKAQQEIDAKLEPKDNFSARGRKKAEHHFPNLLEDIKAIVNPTSQADPTLKSNKLYTPITAKEVRRRLIKEKHYSKKKVPTVRTINNKMNDLGFRLKTIEKLKPIKKIPETDAIFEQVHKVNQEADQSPNILRISIDTKAKVNIGPFSREGKSRQGIVGVDHDFNPETTLFPFGIFLPVQDELYLHFTESKVTADFMVDSLMKIWPMIQDRFNPDMLVINLDNGPDNHGRRTQFIKRMVDFAFSANISIRLAYYPPYHSKYNPIERVWGVLETHWNRELLDSVEKAIGLAQSMTWNGNHPVVSLVDKVYQIGIKLTKKVMDFYESCIHRLKGLEKWFIDIIPSPETLNIYLSGVG